MPPYAINADHVTWEVADGEAVVLHFESSAYYALNPSGTYIWSRLAGGSGEPGALAATIAATTGRAVGEVAADVTAFLESLRAEGLVLAQGPAGERPAAPAADAAPPADYQPPAVTKFGELAKLILSGE
jgi:hypothetical protein